MTERQALLGAGVAHLALVAALSLGLSFAPSPLPPPELSVPVEFVTIAPTSAVTERPRPAPPAQPQETAAPPPVETPPAPQPPAPEPIPEPVAEQPAPPQPKPAPAKPKPVEAARLDAAELSDLIDRKLPKAKLKPLDTSDLAAAIDKAIPKAARLDARATASLESAIRAQVAPCWNPPIGGADVKKMTVVLRIELTRAGAVVGRPTVLSQTGVTGQNGDYARAFAETARRAVLRCAPIKLPAELYDAWRVFELNFDPSEMT